ncbi:3,4-dihydroxy 2-butanone 4-phosphate synthase [Komagataella kurtzmanii]|nr:3,4-dihydroxy 2-butanone 4-phosphate synthase [Komagataella kurtzmanii]
MSVFTPIEDALKAYKNGEFLIVMDDEDRENEGDLIVAAELITTQKMAFLVRYSSGYVCVPLSTKRAAELELPPMIKNRTDRQGTAYTHTVDARDGTTTGISASDRALTCQVLANPRSKPEELMRPGHICPLIAREGLLKERRGHTEAAVQLCELTGLQPAGVIGELVRDGDGSMMRLDDCVQFGLRHNVKIINLDQIIEYMDSKNS